MLDSRQLAGETLIPVGAGLEDVDSVGVKQFSFRELTVRRFMNHPTAKWALLALGILVVACYGAPLWTCLLYTSPSPRDLSTSRMPSSA